MNQESEFNDEKRAKRVGDQPPTSAPDEKKRPSPVRTVNTTEGSSAAVNMAWAISLETGGASSQPRRSRPLLQ